MTGELKQTRREGWRVVVTTARANYACFCMCTQRLTPVLPQAPPAMDQAGKVHALTNTSMSLFQKKKRMFFFFAVLLLYRFRQAYFYPALAPKRVREFWDDIPVIALDIWDAPEC